MSTREMDPVFTAALRELLITTLKDAPRERTRAIDGLKEHEDRLRPSRRGLVASFAILALAAAIVVPLTVGGSTGRPHVEKGAVLRLASYAFRLPSGYRQTKAATHCYVVFGSPGGAPGNEPPTSSQPLPPYQSGIEAAVSASGGCVVMQLAPPYIPTRAPRSGSQGVRPPSGPGRELPRPDRHRSPDLPSRQRVAVSGGNSSLRRDSGLKRTGSRPRRGRARTLPVDSDPDHGQGPRELSWKRV